MPGDSAVNVKLNRFDMALKGVRLGAGKGICALAFALQEQAQQNVEDVDAIDTGAMRASIYTQTSKSDGREGAIADAKARGKAPGVKSGKPNEVPIAVEGERITDDLDAKVGVAAEYGAFVELGTERAEARPFLSPAAEEIGGKADEVVAKFIKEELR